MPGMFKSDGGEPQKPRGNIYAWIESFLLTDSTSAPPQAAGGASTSSSRAERLVWATDLPAALKQAEREKKLVFIDFTGLV